MNNDRSSATPEIVAAFTQYDRDVTINNIRVGCMLGIVLMPAVFEGREAAKGIMGYLGLS